MRKNYLLYLVCNIDGEILFRTPCRSLAVSYFFAFKKYEDLCAFNETKSTNEKENLWVQSFTIEKW